MTICADKIKTSIVHDTYGKENTSSTSEKKEMACDGYVCIYECGKHLCCSTSEHACIATAISCGKVKYNYEDIKYCLVIAKQLKIRAACTEMNTLH